MWCLCTSNGYMVHFETYCEASTDLANTDTGEGADVVLGLVNKCSLRSGMELSFDNSFTCFSVLDELSMLLISGMGTIRENRTEKALVKLNKNKEKLSRGSNDYSCTSDKILNKWKDNKCVSVASSKYDLEPFSKSSRW